jgi:hypothetical protein
MSLSAADKLMEKVKWGEGKVLLAVEIEGDV